MCIRAHKSLNVSSRAAMMADERAFRSFEGVSVRFARRVRCITRFLPPSPSHRVRPCISLTLVHQDDRTRGYNLL